MDNQIPEETIGNKTHRLLMAFSLHNISKMALATLNTLPGTWLGVG
jgi:hypothetical protein